MDGPIDVIRFRQQQEDPKFLAHFGGKFIIHWVRLSTCTLVPIKLISYRVMSNIKSIRGRESVVLRIALYKRTLKSTKAKLHKTTQNIHVPQKSGVVTTRTSVVGLSSHAQFAIHALQPHSF